MRLNISRRAQAAILVIALLSAFAPSVSHGASGKPVGVVVVGRAGLGQTAQAVADHGGRVKGSVELIGAVVARVPSGEVAELTEDPRVASVSPDYAVKVQSDSFSGSGSTTYPRSLNADAMWNKGFTGEGVGVALLDTGISHPKIADSVVASADLTNEGTFSDSYGHGTFLAGLIAGGATKSSDPSGVAPGADLVSVKVAGASGDTTLGQILYGLQLIDASKEKYGIRVVVMALAGPAFAGPDPLVLAVERLWADGLVVVAAAGNSGPGPGSVGSPGVDPYVLTIGSTDEAGTVSRSDDFVPEWSARGPSVYGLKKPDVVAPGKSLISLRVPGSTIDNTYPGARIDDSYFRGSGTSMSAAVAAGGVALMLQEHPELTPDQVKGRLLGTAQPLEGQDANAAGAGAIDVASASTVDAPAANSDLPRLPSRSVDTPADPFGPGRRSFDWFASPIGADRWLARAWAHRTWNGTEFVARGWAARGWAGADWAARGWAARGWAGQDWAARGWAARGWAARGWAADEWSARGWAGVDWASEEWK